MEISDEIKKAIRPFTALGFLPHKVYEDQVIGECPFTGKADKMYVNYKNLCWDSKVAGDKGNLFDWLKAVCKMNEEGYDQSKRERLARDRKLPVSAFEGIGLGFDGIQYTLPIIDAKARVVDVRRWKPGSAFQSTPGCHTTLLWMDELCDNERMKEPVYLCEGEWDAMALRWLLRKCGLPGIVVGLPGAGTFKLEWCPLFDRRDVYCLYDADDAGYKGEKLAFNRLNNVAKSLHFCHWPSDVAEGFDTRDWIVYGAMTKKQPRGCLDKLLSLFQAKPREPGAAADKASSAKQATSKTTKKVKVVRSKPVKTFNRLEAHKQLFRTFQDWLQMSSEEALAVLCGTILANRLEGDPLWLFLVAPPGGMKSELLMSLAATEETYHTSSLTPHALVSGMNLAGGQDPSLMPKLNNKCLVVKDFTAILSLHPTARDEIFGQLRDAYDGHFEKLFGNGVIRRYHAHFGILAGVTPAIDAFSALHSGLGERFLKYRIDWKITKADEKSRIMRALTNTGHEDEMRETLQDAVTEFLEGMTIADIPELEPAIASQIAELGMLAARMRGAVNRDRFSAGLMHNKAAFELGTRISKQLTKLGRGVALYYGKKSVDAETLKTVASVALASVPDKIEEVVRCMWEHDGPITTSELAPKVERLSRATVFRILSDLQMLGLVVNRGDGMRAVWDFGPDFKSLLSSTKVFSQVARSKVVIRAARR